MQDYYEIVQDIDEFNRFLEWLPVLSTKECYYVSLLGRKKYDDTLLSDKAQLKRFTSTKKNLLNKIQQLEIRNGLYQQKETPISQKALALYITINPRSHEKAAKNSLIEFAKLITQEYNGYNSHQVILSELQKSCSRRIFTDFDFDGVNLNDVILEIENKINLDSVSVIQTRGGFHLLVEHEKIKKEFVKTWYNAISKASGCDIKGDSLVQVVGCTVN